MRQFNEQKTVDAINAGFRKAGYPPIEVSRALQRDNFTYYEVVSSEKYMAYVGSGFAKRNPADKPNPGYGRKLALQRAVEDFLGHVKSLKKAVTAVAAVKETVYR